MNFNQNDYSLIIRYLDQDLSVSEVAELSARLKAEVPLRQKFAAILLQQIHLAEITKNFPDPQMEVQPLNIRPGSIERRQRVLATLHIWKQYIRWPWITTAVAVSALCVFVLAQLLNSGLEVLEIEGSGKVIRKGQLLPLTRKTSLRDGDRIQLDAESSTTVGFKRERTRFRLTDAADLRFAINGKQKKLRLEAGSLGAVVAPQSLGHPILISTPQAEAKIVGTEFTLSARNDRTHLEVWTGHVRLTGLFDGVSAEVSQGQYAIAATRLPIVTGAIQGGVLWEFWGGVSGSRVKDLTSDPAFPKTPERRGIWPSIELPLPLGDAYGLRVRGWVHVPRDGEYTFWIAGDDEAELWVSRDETAAHSGKICSTTEHTGPADWEKNPSQRSKPIHLWSGRKYYLEVLMKQAGGGECLGVAWDGPEIERALISSEFLMPQQ